MENDEPVECLCKCGWVGIRHAGSPRWLCAWCFRNCPIKSGHSLAHIPRRLGWENLDPRAGEHVDGPMPLPGVSDEDFEEYRVQAIFAALREFYKK